MRLVALVTFIAAVIPTLVPASGRADSAEAFPGKPYTLSLDGPASVPVNLEMKAAANAPAKLFLEVWMDGKGLKRVSVPPGRTGSTVLTVPAGRHVFEFRADPASKVAVLTWTAPRLVAGPTPAPSEVDPPAPMIIAQATTAGERAPAVSRTKSEEALSRPYSPALGEVVAADLFQVLVSMRAIPAFTTVHYDKNSRTIVLSIFGNNGSVDAAKQGIEELRAKAVEPLSYRAELMYGLKLEDNDFTIRYLNQIQDFREVVRRESGRYVIGD